MDKENRILINKTAIKFQTSQSTIEKIVEDCFKTLKCKLEEPSLPKILIHDFGTFKVRHRTLVGYLLKQILFYRKGIITREEVCDIIKTYWPAKQRLINEEKWSKKKGPSLGRKFSSED